MDAQPKPRPLGLSVLAVVLWLVSFVLGLQAIYDLTQIISVIGVSLGGSLQDAQSSIPVLVFFLAVMFLIDSDFVTGETIRVDGGRHIK